MKHLRYMNEGIMDKDQIDDMFTEYVDKYGFIRGNYSHSDFFNIVYANSSTNKDKVYQIFTGHIGYQIVICFIDGYGSAGVDVSRSLSHVRVLSSEFRNDMERFSNRLRSIGYMVAIEWNGGSIYHINITFKK